ncbi:hypothetical protein VSU19_19760 [Verrucomicrobiales bacterium BCK34]|nr:hypothetical protein [Verrucomicrobiales bacterium BCK34]
MQPSSLDGLLLGSLCPLKATLLLVLFMDLPCKGKLLWGNMERLPQPLYEVRSEALAG